MWSLLISSVIGVVAIGVSVAGVVYAKQQVQLAKKTKSDTKKLLEKIDRKTDDIKKTAESIEKDVQRQVETLLKNFDPTVQAQNKMMENLGPAMLGQLFDSPAVKKKMNEELFKSFGGDK